MQHRRLAITIAAICSAALGVTLAVSDLTVGMDDKSRLESGDRVMAVMPDADGFSWQGPFEISDRTTDRVTLKVAGETRAVDTTQIMPLSAWREREQSKREKH